MAGIGESSSSSSVHKVVDEKPVLVRVKRKASQSRLDALWLEVNERPLKRALLDFESLSVSETSQKEELKTKKIFVQHVETLKSSEATVDIVQSLVATDAADTIENNLKNEERRRNFKRETPKQDQLLVKARQEQEALAKNARFEQIWRSRKEVKDAKDDQLHDMYHIYDIVRLDTNEAPKEEHMSLEEQSMLSSYLPLLREFIPSAAEEIESDINDNVMEQDLPVDDYVYDYYTVKNNVQIGDDNASNPFPLVQVDEWDLYDGPDDSDYETDDSNAENNPNFDYPDEESEEEEEEEEEESGSETTNDETDDDLEEDDLSEDIGFYKCGDTDEDNDADSFDYDGNGDHDEGDHGEGEDWRWSHR